MSPPGGPPIAWPAVSPSPGTTWSTPLGRPASAASSAILRAVSGDCSAGLSTTLLPAARGGERRPELPRRHQEREVPGHDGADDSERLAQHHHEVRGIGRGDLVVDLV